MLYCNRGQPALAKVLTSGLKGQVTVSVPCRSVFTTVVRLLTIQVNIVVFHVVIIDMYTPHVYRFCKCMRKQTFPSLCDQRSTVHQSYFFDKTFLSHLSWIYSVIQSFFFCNVTNRQRNNEIENNWCMAWSPPYPNLFILFSIWTYLTKGKRKDFFVWSKLPIFDCATAKKKVFDLLPQR